MKRGSWSVAILLLLPALGAAEVRGQRVYGRNLEQLVSDIADWSTPHSLPEDFGAIYKVSLCQTRPWRTPKTPHPDCRPMLYAPGAPSHPGYIRADVAQEGGVLRSSGDWYQLSSKGSVRLWTQFQHQTPWMDETNTIRSADVDNLIKEIADWSQESDPPAGFRRTARFLFCQHQHGVKVAPPPRVESCYIFVFAPGSIRKPGSIRVAEADGGDTKGYSETWFTVTPKWDAILNGRLRRGEYLSYWRSYSPSPPTYSDPGYRGCWYPAGENHSVVVCE